jgi:hypothetical protein
MQMARGDGSSTALDPELASHDGQLLDAPPATANPLGAVDCGRRLPMRRALAEAHKRMQQLEAALLEAQLDTFLAQQRATRGFCRGPQWLQRALQVLLAASLASCIDAWLVVLTRSPADAARALVADGDLTELVLGAEPFFGLRAQWAIQAQHACMRWLALGSSVHWAGTMLLFVGADVLQRAAVMGGHALLGTAVSFSLLMWAFAVNVAVLILLVQLAKKSTWTWVRGAWQRWSTPTGGQYAQLQQPAAQPAVEAHASVSIVDAPSAPASVADDLSNAAPSGTAPGAAEEPATGAEAAESLPCTWRRHGLATVLLLALLTFTGVSLARQAAFSSAVLDDAAAEPAEQVSIPGGDCPPPSSSYLESLLRDGHPDATPALRAFLREWELDNLRLAFRDLRDTWHQQNQVQTEVPEQAIPASVTNTTAGASGYTGDSTPLGIVIPPADRVVLLALLVPLMRGIDIDSEPDEPAPPLSPSECARLRSHPYPWQAMSNVLMYMPDDLLGGLHSSIFKPHHLLLRTMQLALPTNTTHMARQLQCGDEAGAGSHAPATIAGSAAAPAAPRELPPCTLSFLPIAVTFRLPRTPSDAAANMRRFDNSSVRAAVFRTAHLLLVAGERVLVQRNQGESSLSPRGPSSPVNPAAPLQLPDASHDDPTGKVCSVVLFHFTLTLEQDMFFHGDTTSAQLAFRLLVAALWRLRSPAAWCLSEEQRALDVRTARRWQLAMALPGFRFLLDEAGFVRTPRRPDDRWNTGEQIRPTTPEEQQRLWDRLQAVAPGVPEEARTPGNEQLWPDGPFVEPDFAWAFGAQAPLRCTLQPGMTAGSDSVTSLGNVTVHAAASGANVSSEPERYGSLLPPASELRTAAAEALHLLQAHVSDVHAQEEPDYRPFQYVFQYYPNRCELQDKSA